MPRVSAKATITLRGLRRFRSVLSNRSGLVQDAFNEWGSIYSDFTHRRFIRFSAGGGNWRRHAESTTAARHMRGNFSDLLLRDTDRLLEELNPISEAAVGVRSSKLPFGIRVNFNSGATYPDGTPVYKVIAWHHRGASNLPRRRIFVQPDLSARQKMAGVMTKALVQESKAT